jgi:hypothetical protein
MTDRPAPAGAPEPTQPVGGYGIELPPGVAPEARSDGRLEPNALASLVVGMSGLIVGWCCFPFGSALIALTGVVLGIVSLSRIASRPGQYSGRGLAISGIVVSVAIPLVLAALYVLGMYFL